MGEVIAEPEQRLPSEAKLRIENDNPTKVFVVLPASVEGVEIPRSDHILAIVTFSLIGVTQLLIWNMIINYSVSLQQVIWPGKVSLDILGGTEHAAALIVSVLMLKFNGLSVMGCQVWTVLNVVFYLIFPLIPQFYHGNEHYGIAQVLLATICAGLGFSAGMLHVYGYAFASVLPHNYVGWVSTGNGIAGAYSFLVFALLSEAVFLPQDSLSAQLSLGWVFFISGAVLGVAQIICFWLLSKKQWFKDAVYLAKDKKEHDVEAAVKQWGPRRPVWDIFKDCWGQALNSSFTLFVTLFIFPVCGPFGWHQEYTITSTLNGTFQIVDLLLRWLPTLGGWTKIPKKYLWLAVLLRPVIFVPFFVLPNRLPATPFVANAVWLFIVMITFTVTNGWFVTLGAMYCPECVQHPMEKEVAAEIYVIMLLSFVTVGIYASKIPVL